MKKKIVFSINTFLVGGIEKALIELLKNKSLEKYEVTLLIGYKLNEIEKLKIYIPKNIKIKYILEESIFTEAKKKKAIGKLTKIEKIIDESISWIKKIIFKNRLLKILQNQDVVIDYDMTLAPYAKLIKIKKIAYCHFSLKNYNRGIKSRQKKLGERLNNYDNVVVISDDMKKEASVIFPFLSKKIVKIYNSFNINDIKNQAQKLEDKDLINCKEKYILAIGRLEETQKDFTTLIKAFSLIKDIINENLYVLGDGRHRDELEKLCQKLKIENRVVFLGFKNNPYSWMKKAEIFVHSSKFEGLPTVLIEALILGTPIVATDCPTGPREILEDGKNGLLVKIGDEQDLSKKILKMIKEPNVRQNCLKEGEKSISRFDGKVVIKELEALF
ncbi:MAG: glycosyltransferase [Cetobacterium sp.]